MIEEFYGAMGWENDGTPSEEKLESLGLWEVPDIGRTRKVKMKKSRPHAPGHPYLPATNRQLRVESRKEGSRARKSNP